MLLTLLVIALIITILATFLSAIVLFFLFYTRVPFVKTPQKVIDTILKEVKIEQSDTVYDIGCGDASTLITIEKETGAKTIGLELTPIAFAKGLFNIWKNKSKTKILYRNFYKENLSQANIVFCFLIDSVMKKVGQQLDKQLMPGSKVIAFAFPIPHWKPTKIFTPFPAKRKSSKIYIYQK